MKYIHFIKDRKFAEPYINFINKNFNNQDHKFFVIGHEADKYKLFSKNNVTFISKKNFAIKLVDIYLSMYKAKRIYIHFLSSFELFILLLQPWTLKKTNWVIWGGDLYYYKDRKKGFTSNLIEQVRRVVIRNISEISYLTKGDYDLAKKWYHTCAIPKKAIYPTPLSYEFLDEIMKQSAKRNNIVNIQVGNSATESNNHFEILSVLAKFNSEDIRIYCPLSYGNDEYKKKVVQYGSKIFGEKFVPLLDFIKIEDYYKYLSKIDIGVFTQNRQQALGNILPLIYLGKKVFIRNDISTWGYLKGEFDIDLYGVNTISNLKFREFIHLDENEAKGNHRKISIMRNNDYFIEIWRKNLEY
jgi:dTDP-N-acetylfucosamine:lipid II N-acetylfucosaminyltransferase